jgi:hypothetical protein
LRTEKWLGVESKISDSPVARRLIAAGSPLRRLRQPSQHLCQQNQDRSVVALQQLVERLVRLLPLRLWLYVSMLAIPPPLLLVGLWRSPGVAGEREGSLDSSPT